MTSSEIVNALRAMADRIEKGGKQAPPTNFAPKPTGQGITGKVAFWDVKIRDNGKPMASLKLADGQRFPCFDEKVISAIDPLVKGQNVTVFVKPWEKKDGETVMLITGVNKGHAGIEEEEIPF